MSAARPICLAHKLIPPGMWPASPEMAGKSLLLTCLLQPGHDGLHVCGDRGWAAGSSDCASLGCTHGRGVE